MKFCAKCGTPLADEAMFCTNCGTAAPASAPQPTYAAPQQTYAAPQPTYVAPQPTYVAPQQAEQIKADVPKSHCVFNLIYAISSVLAIAFAILSLAFEWISVSSSASVSYWGIDVSSYVYAWPHETYVILAFSFAVVGLAFGIVSFVTALKNKLDNNMKFTAIARFVNGIIITVLTTIMMCESIF